MRATAKRDINRIELNREELWALLSFTGSSEHTSVVHFRINGSGKIQAAATDEKRSVEARGKAEGASPCEIAIDAAFLEKCRAGLEKGEGLVLELTKGGAGVKDALVIEAESGDEICRLGWNRECADTQKTMGDIITDLKLPNDKNHTGSWCAIDPRALAPLERIRVATEGCPITLWPPTSPEASLFFEARCDDAHWKGAIKPERVVGPGDQADEPEEDDAPGGKAKQQSLKYSDVAGSSGTKPEDWDESKADSSEKTEAADDGVVDDSYTGEEPVKTKTKSSSKKASTKKGRAKK